MQSTYNQILLMESRNLWSASIPWVHNAKMSSINLIHSIGVSPSGAFRSIGFSRTAMNVFA